MQKPTLHLGLRRTATQFKLSELADQYAQIALPR